MGKGRVSVFHSFCLSNIDDSSRLVIWSLMTYRVVRSFWPLIGYFEIRWRQQKRRNGVWECCRDQLHYKKCNKNKHSWKLNVCNVMMYLIYTYKYDCIYVNNTVMFNTVHRLKSRAVLFTLNNVNRITKYGHCKWPFYIRGLWNLKIMLRKEWCFLLSLLYSWLTRLVSFVSCYFSPLNDGWNTTMEIHLV